MAPPKFSVVTPTFNTPAGVLRAALTSVRRQTWPDWEHCIVDDGSTDPDVRRILDEASAADTRVRVRYRATQGGIVAATNEALAMASGEFVALLDHDDELDPRALEAMARAIDASPDVDYLYSDEDKIDESGRHFEPFLKPGWSPDRLRAQMYTTHFSVVRRSLVDELTGLRPGFDGSQDWDLVLRVAERTGRVVHVPEILYHWRTIAGSAAGAVDAKPWAHEAGRRALAEHIDRIGIQATPEPVPGYPGNYWLRPALRAEPLVSIVIPTAGRSGDVGGHDVPLVVNCVRSIVDRSTYENYEIVVVVDEHAPSEVGDELRVVAGDRLRIVPFDQPFNFSTKVNVGVEASRGEQILLLNDDVEVIPRGWRPAPKNAPHGIPDWDIVRADGRRAWIEEMLAYAMQGGVGAVGAKLYFPDGTLQHAGVIARSGYAMHPYYGFAGNDAGYAGNLFLPGNYLAVTAACVMTPRPAFEKVGGFDEGLPLNYNDVDFCLKLREAGYRTVLVPPVELVHYESVSRGRAPARDEEVDALRKRWGDLLYADPYYPARFLDGSYTLPVYTSGGQFRSKHDPRNYINRFRRAYAEGGVRLVAVRVAEKLRRGLGRLFARSRAV